MRSGSLHEVCTHTTAETMKNASEKNFGLSVLDGRGRVPVNCWFMDILEEYSTVFSS